MVWNGVVGRKPREAASPSALAVALARWGTAQGIDLFQDVGLGAGDADAIAVPTTAVALAAMLARASAFVGEPHLALRLPAELSHRRWDAGALAARVAATPRDVLVAIGRFGGLVFPRLEAVVVDGKGELRFHAHVRGLVPSRHVNEYVLAFALGHCRRGGAPVIPQRVWLSSARAAGDLAPLYAALGTDEIELGAEDTGFALSLEAAACVLPAIDPMLVEAAEQIASAALALAPCPSGSIGPVVAAKVDAALASGAPSAVAVAAALRMSARTLQRRLGDEGLRFSAISDDVRERAARGLLDDPALSLVEVAYRLGFSDLAAFSRAFKRWTRMPPGAYRRR